MLSIPVVKLIEALEDAVAVASNFRLPEGTKGKLVTLDMELLLCFSIVII